MSNSEKSRRLPGLLLILRFYITLDILPKAVLVHKDEVLTEIILNGEWIETTPEHPFYTEEEGWLPAGELKMGMHVVQADGTTGAVWLKWDIHHEQKMYNLTVDTAHTFYVGEGQWLVHNTCGAGEFTSDQQVVRDLAQEASRGPARGRPPLSQADADTLLSWADEYRIPADPSTPHVTGGHWDPLHNGNPVSHIHIGPYHVPVAPDYISPYYVPLGR